MGSRLDILVSDIQTIRLFFLVIVLTAFEISVLLLVYQEIYTERMVLVRCIYLCI